MKELVSLYVRYPSMTQSYDNSIGMSRYDVMWHDCVGSNMNDIYGRHVTWKDDIDGVKCICNISVVLWHENSYIQAYSVVWWGKKGKGGIRSGKGISRGVEK